MPVIEDWASHRKAYLLKLKQSRRVYEIDAFEAKDPIEIFGHTELRVENSKDMSHRRGRLVTLYAKMGLHRYNLIEGKNYQFSALEKYNYTALFGPNRFYITLAAIDPANGSSTHFILAKVNEHSFGTLDLTCDIAVPRGDPNVYPHRRIDRFIFHRDKSLPKWPLEDPFNSPQLFYVVNKSELQENDWIRLYLELAVAKSCSMYFKDLDLSKLEVLKVDIETSSQYPDKGCLSAKNITVYISYRDPNEARIGKDFDRIAIVRKNYDDEWKCLRLVGLNQSSEAIPKSSDEQQSGCLSLVDQNKSSPKIFDEQQSRLVALNQSSQTIPKKSRCKNAFKKRLGVHKPWLLFIPKWRKAYKNCGVHKTRSI